MKKILSTVAAAAVLATSGLANDASFDLDKAYLIAGVAIENADYAGVDTDMGLAIVLGGGLPVMKLGEGSLVTEAELTYSVMAPSADYDFGYYGSGSVDFTFMTLGAYAGWQYNIDKQYFVKPRVGLIYKSVDSDGGGDDSEIGLALGVQGGMKLNENLDLTIGLNLVDGMDLTHLTAGVQYHF